MESLKWINQIKNRNMCKGTHWHGNTDMEVNGLNIWSQHTQSREVPCESVSKCHIFRLLKEESKGKAGKKKARKEVINPITRKTAASMGQSIGSLKINKVDQLAKLTKKKEKSKYYTKNWNNRYCCKPCRYQKNHKEMADLPYTIKFENIDGSNLL